MSSIALLSGEKALATSVLYVEEPRAARGMRIPIAKARRRPSPTIAIVADPTKLQVTTNAKTDTHVLLALAKLMLANTAISVNTKSEDRGKREVDGRGD